jgi:uracil-DNA glycosylase
MEVKIEESWKKLLKDEFEKSYFINLVQFLKDEYKTKTVYPKGKRIFYAFECCPFDKVKVVILGQDPYHGPNQANGLCFSVNDGIELPPSLQNIFKELSNDLGISAPQSGNLTRWANQGVFLLNSTLTVRENEPGSHQGKGWEIFTDEVIKLLATTKKNLVFMLWGKFAQDKEKLISPHNHLILKASHPSPLSANRGFFGCKHFSKANDYLIKNGFTPIYW